MTDLPLLDKIVCNDGTIVSVQASKLHYCTPRDDEGPYTRVEVGFPSAEPSWWSEFAEDPTTLETVAPYVSIEHVKAFIDEHGGIREGQLPLHVKEEA